MLQARLNRNPEEIRHGGTVFRKGDRVIQTVNDYEKCVFNGDMGIIRTIDRENRTLFVLFDGRLVSCEFTQLDSLALSYAITIHKSQGSEFPVVIIPVHTVNTIMLERHLLYTGFSRARQMLVVIGSRKAMRMGACIENVQKRNTLLKERLTDQLPGQFGENPDMQAVQPFAV